METACPSAHAFGKHKLGIVHDMWVMRDVDVFVTFHGAGEMNAIFIISNQMFSRSLVHPGE